MKVKNNIETPPYHFDESESSSEYHSAPEGVGRIDVSYGPYNDTMLKKMLPFRKRFVEMMGWRPEDTYSSLPIPFALNWLALPGYEDARKDVDRYDCMEETLHFAISDRDSDEIIAGLRLTPVSSVRSSLSWEMFRDSHEMLGQALSHETNGVNTIDSLDMIASQGNLWDLTRLVNQFDEHADLSQVMGGMMELFGVAFGYQRKHAPESQQADVTWIFNGTEALKAALEHLHIEFDVIAGGNISPEDTTKSYFCVVNCDRATRNIYARSDEAEFKFPHRHADDGLRKAHAL